MSKFKCSPFDDPIVNACFANAEIAGEAVRSLSNSITSGDGIVIDKVISVVPQFYSKIPGERGTRVDVKSKTASNQDIIIEVNMHTDKTIHQRNFLAAAQAVTSSSSANTTHSEMADRMPYVIAINILNYTLRTDNDDWFQPAKFVYTKPPHTVALPQYVSYDIELPKFKNAASDWNDDLYCWIYALVKAHEEKLTLKEVIDMNSQLNTFADQNMGFKQFSERYEFIATNEQIRDEYLRWQRELLRQYGLIEGAREEGRAETLEKVRIEKLAGARMLVEAGTPIELVIKAFRLTPDEATLL